MERVVIAMERSTVCGIELQLFRNGEGRRRASLGSFRIAALYRVMDGKPVGCYDVSGAK
jgi:hypothetical protein